MQYYKHIFYRVVAITCVVCFFSGCAKAPDEELARAKAALKAALEVEADKYMAKNFQNLQKALDSAEAEIAKQKSSFFLSRKYTRATQLLKNTTALAIELKKEAPRAKVEMEETVRNNLSLAGELVKITSNNIRKSSAFKNKHLITALKTELKTADSIAGCASADYKAGNILGASNNLSRFQELITKISDQIVTNSSMVQFDEAEVN